MIFRVYFISLQWGDKQGMTKNVLLAFLLYTLVRRYEQAYISCMFSNCEIHLASFFFLYRGNLVGPFQFFLLLSCFMKAETLLAICLFIIDDSGKLRMYTRVCFVYFTEVYRNCDACHRVCF